MGDELVASWLAAVAPAPPAADGTPAPTAPAAAGLEAIYTDLAGRIAQRRPRCEASGRCCRFEEHGHLLYVTGLETAYALTRLPRATPLTPESLAAARARGGCPFQIDRLCAIHTIKPLGCRIYFCDPTAQEWQQDLYEELLTRLRALHETHGLEYRYGEWRTMLAAFLPHLPAPAPGPVQSHEPPPVRLTVDGSELP